MKQANYRIRDAASLARPGWTWAAALVMNIPAVAVAALLGWLTWTSYEPALEAVAGILFVIALVWAALVTMESWHVLRRFSRRRSADRITAA